VHVVGIQKGFGSYQYHEATFCLATSCGMHPSTQVRQYASFDASYANLASGKPLAVTKPLVDAKHQDVILRLTKSCTRCQLVRRSDLPAASAAVTALLNKDNN